MSYAPNPDALRSAFAAERFAFEGASLQFALAEAGRLVVGNGKIAAGDPQAELAPFTQCVPNGEYPVTLAQARSEHDGQRLAYARVLLDPAPVVHWYPALTSGQDARALQPGDFFGSVLESGSACFASAGSMVSFSSGAGPGRYASFFGYDGAGRAVALVTDFGLVPGIRGTPPAHRAWWHRLLFFWK